MDGFEFIQKARLHFSESFLFDKDQKDSKMPYFVACTSGYSESTERKILDAGFDLAIQFLTTTIFEKQILE